jgi:hypothetical protein
VFSLHRHSCAYRLAPLADPALFVPPGFFPQVKVQGLPNGTPSSIVSSLRSPRTGPANRSTAIRRFSTSFVPPELKLACRSTLTSTVATIRPASNPPGTTPGTSHQASPNPAQVELHDLTQSVKLFLREPLAETRCVESSVVDSLDTLPLRSPGRVSMTLRWTKTCKVLDSTNESGQRNGRLMPPPK